MASNEDSAENTTGLTHVALLFLAFIAFNFIVLVVVQGVFPVSVLQLNLDFFNSLLTYTDLACSVHFLGPAQTVLFEI